MTGLAPIHRDAYHSRPEVSKSMLWSFHTSGCPAAYVERTYPPPSPEMNLGTAVHALLLEPDTPFEDHVAIEPERPDEYPGGWWTNKKGEDVWKDPAEFSTNTPAHREWWAAELVGFEDTVGSRARLTAEQARLAHRIAESVMASDAAVYFEDLSFAEHAVFWTDPMMGLKCRALADLPRPDMGLCFDLKCTGQGADAVSFRRQVTKFGYHVQAAHYLDGLRLGTEGVEWLGFPFIVVETSEPFRVAAWTLPEAAIEEGRRIQRAALEGLFRCTELGAWPGYDVGVESVLPWFGGASDSEEIVEYDGE